MTCILCMSDNTFELNDEVLCSACGTTIVHENLNGHKLSYFLHPNGGWSIDIQCSVMGWFLEHNCESLEAAKERAQEILKKYGRIEY